MKNTTEIIEFLHKCEFASLKGTWTKETDKGFLQHGVKGHLQQKRMNVRITKFFFNKESNEIFEDEF